MSSKSRQRRVVRSGIVVKVKWIPTDFYAKRRKKRKTEKASRKKNRGK